MQTLIKVFTACFILALTVGCQSTSGVSRDYRDAVKSNRKLDNRKTTTLLILVDGLSKDILTSALKSNRAQRMDSFFSLSSENGFKYQLAVSSFPSLTYPNLTSILTGSKVSEHGIIGNRILLNRSVVNFEHVLAWDTLDQLVEDRTVFSRLRNRNLTSVSYSYPFPLDTTAHVEKSIEAGIQYIDERYDEIDKHSIESLDYMLSRTDPETWPRFIFLHLIGVDALSHKYGPNDERVSEYVGEVDQRLGLVFETLKESTAQNQHQFNVVLTSDHGAKTIRKGIDVTPVIERLDKDIQLLQDNRIATIRFPASYTTAQKQKIARELLQIQDLKATILNSNKELEVFARSEAPITANEDLLWPSLEDYFASPNAPDLLLLPKDDIDFSGDYAGNHGGFTSDEMLVPLLVRDVEIPDENFPTSDLLKILGLVK